MAPGVAPPAESGAGMVRSRACVPARDWRGVMDGDALSPGAVGDEDAVPGSVASAEDSASDPAPVSVSVPGSVLVGSFVSGMKYPSVSPLFCLKS